MNVNEIQTVYKYTLIEVSMALSELFQLIKKPHPESVCLHYMNKPRSEWHVAVLTLDTNITFEWN